MPIGDLLELIVCTDCKTRVEYHDDRDGYMSCECWIRSTADDPTPDKWMDIEDRKVNLCGGCRANIPERSVFRCADCGLPFHQTCLDQHCKHGNQKQELRSENLFLKTRIATAVSQLCAAREVTEGFVKLMEQSPHSHSNDWKCSMCDLLVFAKAALSSSSLTRLREALKNAQ
jgi:uncharacterized protein YbaR (Trm112 family)